MLTVPFVGVLRGDNHTEVMDVDTPRGEVEHDDTCALEVEE